MAITPRHYLDFINHYANLFNEKRSELEEQQMHLNVGLRKIKETVDQVHISKTLPSIRMEWLNRYPCLLWILSPILTIVSQVEELRRDLRIKSQELEVKNAAANDKLKKMVKDQQEAEKKKVKISVHSKYSYLWNRACRASTGRSSTSKKQYFVCEISF